jgi:hypothetical protein
MIDKRLYLKALRIVEEYHEQTKENARLVKEIEGFKTVRVYRNLDSENDAQPGDFVTCVFKHSASSFTRNKDYEILRVDSDRFQIENDKGTKKWHYKSNKHFKLI